MRFHSDPDHNRYIEVVGIPGYPTALRVQVIYQPLGTVTCQTGIAIDEHIVPLIKAAPDLLAACHAAVTWAETPGDHGGNPWCKDFVKLADAAVRQADGATFSHWTDIPDHPVADWQAEVAANETRQSYRQWVESRQEED